MDLRSRMELNKLITKPTFTGNGFQICASGMKSRVNIISIDTPNAPNMRAHTVNVVKKDFSVIVSLLFVF